MSMSSNSTSAFGTPRRNDTTLCLATRLFAWITLAVLAAFLINNFLSLSQDWPGAFAAFTGAGSLSFVQLALYLGTIGAAIAYVLMRPDTPLREDAARITGYNTFLIRAAFWAVLFVGIGDALISFIRVEGMLGSVVGDDLATKLSRPQFRGPYVHIPLILAGIIMAAFTRTLGFLWFAVLIVLAELLIVITRFVFSYEQAFMGDLVRFWYAALFLFASAYTLLEEGHVRVDVFYAGFADKTKGRVNAIGSIILGMVLCWTILAIGMGGKASIINSPVMNFEVSQSGFGMYIKYLMAGFLGLFAISMLIQFSSYLLEGVADYRGDPGKREVSGDSGH
ncbi:MAG: TRAP transporter small permease subunit [Neomegalonema sp.]|nr:TRAP transporter small permease subunit [Neomegalonema sp.]